MSLIDYTTTWVKGDVFQGKIMLAVGILVLVAAISIFKSQHELLKGMLVPMALALLILIGYGSVLTFGRPNHLIKITEVYTQTPKKAVEMEYAKALKDSKAYSSLKIVWPILILLSVLFYLFVSKEVYKGLGIGLVAFFIVGLLIDSLLHHRLQPYMKALAEYSTSS